ncbi:uncharacterized protein LOC111620812 [Centruroides sculpturatus]|uniref:uncharacterized protein LOC111620812 n=1 Tax=Centruroides sculpturatus TaxID=218467 RepID=UPI000C6CBECB|nr:uncharacterized protein LOC111620812 [Centruroides sculpturatus]
MGVGAAFVEIDCNNRVVHQAYYKLGPFCTINQAESLAILKSLEHIQRTINNRTKEEITIISDSRVALHQIKAMNTKFKLIKDIIHMVSNLKSNHIKVHFHWTKGHSGEIGNDKADFLAKKAISHLNGPTFSLVPYNWVKNQLKEFTINRWQERWATETTGRVTFNFFPDVKGRDKLSHFNPDFHITQYITGHGGFKQYLNRFLNKGTSICECQEEDETPEHILFTCVKHVTHRKQLKHVMYSQGFHWPCRSQDFLTNNITTTVFKTFILKTGNTFPNFTSGTIASQDGLRSPVTID